MDIESTPCAELVNFGINVATAIKNKLEQEFAGDPNLPQLAELTDAAAAAFGQMRQLMMSQGQEPTGQPQPAPPPVGGPPQG